MCISLNNQFNLLSFSHINIIGTLKITKTLISIILKISMAILLIFRRQWQESADRAIAHITQERPSNAPSMVRGRWSLLAFSMASHVGIRCSDRRISGELNFLRFFFYSGSCDTSATVNHIYASCNNILVQ